MADNDGYHPPQFSEEAAWLPPWLRPSQLPLSVDGHDQHLATGCEILEYHQENVGDSDRNDGDAVTKEESRFFSCHLFLSGGDDSSVFNAHSSGNVSCFHLHLSSENISQLSEEFGDVHASGTFKSNRESVPEHSVVQNEVDCEHHTKTGDHPANISAGRCSPIISQKLPSALSTRTNEDDGKENKQKLDVHLETIDIDDALELIIAASEAVVISELTTSISHPEFNSAAILEVALRVKQARNKWHVDVLDAVSSNPTDEHDETEELHELDDYIMADAFEDVGLPCNQIVTAPNDSFDSKVSTTKSLTYICNSEKGHFPYADDLSVPNTHLSEDHDCGVMQGNEPKAQDHGISATALQEKVSYVFPMDSKLKQPPLQACSLNHMEPSVCSLNLDILNVSNIRDQVRVKSSQKNGDDSTPAENLSNEERNIQDGEDITHREKQFRGEIPNLFHGETSFISESMDVPTDGNAIVRTPEAEPKIVASSNSLFEDLHRIPYDENKITTDEDIGAPCNLLEIDTLCSVVPCSLSSDDTHVPHGCNQEGRGMGDGWCLKPTTELVGMQNPEESLPFIVDAQRGIFVASEIRDKYSTVTCEQSSSLKNYSVVVPAKSTFSSGKSFSLRELIPTVSINENKYCILPSKEETTRIHVKPTTKSQGINEQNYSWKNHVKDYRSSTTTESISTSTEHIPKQKEAQNNDVGPMVQQHADASAPIILNTGSRRRLRACNTISPRKYEDENLKDSLPSKMEKCRTRNSGEVHCRNTACINAACSPCSSSHAHFLEQYPTIKKVRFSEAEVNVHYLPENLSEEQWLPTKKVGSSKAGADSHCDNAIHKMNIGCQTCFRTKTREKNKGSSKPFKCRTRKSSYRYLTNDFSKGGKRQMLEGLQFLLTGFSKKKQGEIETLIRRHGGLILPDIPVRYLSMDYADGHLPIVLSPKKVQTTKFLFGCAIKTWLLHNYWLSDSVQAGFMLPPAKYLTLPNQISERRHLRIEQLHLCNFGAIFDKVGVMLFGNPKFCAKFSKVIKFGGGCVYKALHWLVQSLKNGKNTVGAIVAGDEINVSRHLKHCALEHDLYMMPASWITNSLFSGKLLPCKKDRTAPLHRIKKPRFPQLDHVNVCEET